MNKLLLHFDNYSKHVQGKSRKQGDLPSVTVRWGAGRPPGCTGFPRGGWEGTGGSGTGQQQAAGCRAGGDELGAADQGLCFDLSLTGSLSPSPILRNMFWKLYPEGTRPFGDSLFLDPWPLMTFRGVFPGPSSD